MWNQGKINNFRLIDVGVRLGGYKTFTKTRDIQDYFLFWGEEKEINRRGKQI